MNPFLFKKIVEQLENELNVITSDSTIIYDFKNYDDSSIIVNRYNKYLFKFNIKNFDEHEILNKSTEWKKYMTKCISENKSVIINNKFDGSDFNNDPYSESIPVYTISDNINHNILLDDIHNSGNDSTETEHSENIDHVYSVNNTNYRINKIDESSNFNITIETGDKPCGNPSGGKKRIETGDIIRLWSKTLDINIKENSSIINIEEKPRKLEKGPIGPTGPYVKGPTGPIGPIGFDGSTGPTGPRGPVGQRGLYGPTGPIGPIGFDGSTGPTGPMGLSAKLFVNTNSENPVDATNKIINISSSTLDLATEVVSGIVKININNPINIVKMTGLDTLIASKSSIYSIYPSNLVLSHSIVPFSTLSEQHIISSWNNNNSYYLDISGITKECTNIIITFGISMKTIDIYIPPSEIQIGVITIDESSNQIYNWINPVLNKENSSFPEPNNSNKNILIQNICLPVDKIKKLQPIIRTSNKFIDGQIIELCSFDLLII